MTTNTPIWAETPGWRGLPALVDEVEADVCVVGLGGSGLSAVGELLRMGLRVVGLDAGSLGGGAAGRNGGFLLAGTADFYHDSVEALGRPRARELYRLTMAEIDRIEAETPEAVRRVGSLRIAASAEEEADCRRQLEATRADGFPVEAYDGPEGRGLYFPADGVFQPLLRCRLLAERAVDAGARLFEHSPAVRLLPGEVRTPRGRVRCGATLVAVDGRLACVLPELADRARTVRLQMLATAPAPDVRIPLPVYYRWGFEYWHQLPDGAVVLGGFRDAGGEEEWTTDATPSPRVQGLLEDFLRTRLGVEAPVTHRWAASVSYSTTAVPILDEVRPGVWAVGAYSGTGNVVGALCGRAAARRIVNGGDDVAGLFTDPRRAPPEHGAHEHQAL
ncbi:MAG TPA: FAD-binding oxidoreductase [Longimicrobiales bacterium]|nr:FAD-binding oxidoreductase [Longimicrobiales bacterium]